LEGISPSPFSKKFQSGSKANAWNFHSKSLLVGILGQKNEDHHLSIFRVVPWKKSRELWQRENRAAGGFILKEQGSGL
jgi:hypothetical protein